VEKKARAVLLLVSLFLLTGCTKNTADDEGVIEGITSVPKDGTVIEDQQEPAMKPRPTQPQMQIDTEKTYTAVLTTSEGEITVKLFAKQTPITVNNFVALAKDGYYNGTTFHRVIAEFMIQGGDPKGDGTGGPGYTFADEPFEGEYMRGTVAMANAGPNTNGSQFFIMHQDYPLPKNYVIFGEVTKGIEVVDTIAEAPVRPSPTGEPSVPLNPVVVSSVIVLED